MTASGGLITAVAGKSDLSRTLDVLYPSHNTLITVLRSFGAHVQQEVQVGRECCLMNTVTHTHTHTPRTHTTHAQTGYVAF